MEWRPCTHATTLVAHSSCATRAGPLMIAARCVTWLETMHGHVARSGQGPAGRPNQRPRRGAAEVDRWSASPHLLPDPCQ